MDFSLFHFSAPEWLYGLLVIPGILLLHLLIQPKNTASTASQERLLEKFIDKHLLPHLLAEGSSNKARSPTIYSLILWSFIWCMMMLAMAGPRWSYREFQMFLPEQKMVILLDLSESMNADDIKPTRMSRARLEIEEILRLNTQLNIGMVGFAAHAHMISPITGDHENIKYLLPLLGTDLVSVQGSRLLPALKMANDMLISKNKTNNTISNASIVILSDGGFQDSESLKYIQKLATQGVTVHAIGVGTSEGVTFVDGDGNPIIKNGKAVTSKLDEDKMQEVSRIAKGSYFPSHYSDRNAHALRKILDSQNNQFTESQQTTKHWDEKFYIFIFPILLIIIFWFRRGFIFPFILAAIFLPASSHAANHLSDLSSRLLLNDQNFAKKLIEEDHSPEEALSYLSDPYRKGIAYYRSGNYDKAAAEFQKNTRKEVAKESLYNLGNSLAMQNKLEEALKAYKQAIELDQNFQDAEYNLELIKKMLEEQQKQDQQQQQQQSEKQEDNQDQQGDQNQQNQPNIDDKNDQRSKDSNTDNDSNKNDNSDEDTNHNDQQDHKNNNNNQNDNKQDNSKNENSQRDQDNSTPNKDDAGEDQNNEQHQNQDNSSSPEHDTPSNQSESASSPTSDENIDIDEWLNRISDDHKNFLRNQFYLESQKQKELDKSNNNLDPW